MQTARNNPEAPHITGPSRQVHPHGPQILVRYQGKAFQSTVVLCVVLAHTLDLQLRILRIPESRS
jgi:hypothetical protein